MSRAHLLALALSALSTWNSENIFGEQSCNCWVPEWLFRQSSCLDVLILSDAFLETSSDQDSSFVPPCHHPHTCHSAAKVILPTNYYCFSPVLSWRTWNTRFFCIFEDYCIFCHNLTSFWFSHRSYLPHSCYPVLQGFFISCSLPNFSEIFVAFCTQSQWLVSSSASTTTNYSGMMMTDVFNMLSMEDNFKIEIAFCSRNQC